jgi:putative endopeptidase
VEQVIMKILQAVLVTAILCAAALAQEAPQHGVQVGDIDRKADPCTNFYDFANGAWRAANPIPPSMQRWSRRWAAGEQNKEQIRTLLDDLSRRTDWPKSSVEQQITDFHRACMDEAAIDKLGIKPIEPMLAEIDAMKSNADLNRMIVRLQDIGISSPFGLYSSPDNHDPANVIAYVYASGLGLPDRDYYVKPDQRFADARAKYVTYVAGMFQLAGYKEAGAKAAAATVMRMETALAEHSLDNVALRDPASTDHKVPFAELRKMTPHFDWAAFFQQAKLPLADLNVNEPDFMKEVERQLTAEPLAAWKTYLKWQLLNSAAPSLSKPFQEESFNFYGAYLGGAREMKPRWKRCVEQNDALLGEALGQKYVERYFPPAAKARVEEMVTNLRAAMKDTIEGLDWMTPATKQKALAKLAAFRVKVGYPDKWKDYSSVDIGPGSYWANVIAGRRYNVDDDRSQVGKPVDRGRWGMTPPTSDAYNNFQMNEIVFPAGILQPPAFDVNAVDAVNYGAIGVVIGHEISHGFDDIGAQFDADGSLHNWWSAEDLAQFRKRTACIVEQYDGYFIEPGIHHNGRLVTGEAIGDQAGAKIAYLAFQKAEQQRPAPTLDGFTPDQQFFIAWGQFRGDETRPEAQRLMVQGDPHPVAKFRVIGPLSNLPAFQKAFACKPGDAMVRPPDKRCEVW